ncbi:glycosyltransferase family 2 protein [Rhodovibrionaceae bacterium A322]
MVQGSPFSSASFGDSGPTVDIVIVTWNAGLQIRECLEALAASDWQGMVLNKVVLADNGSSDGSLDSLQDINLPLEVLQNGANLGFGRACNKGAALGQGEFVLFLNPDTKVTPWAVAASVKELARPENDDVAILGAQLLNDDGSIARCCARLPSAGNFWSMVFGLHRLFPARAGGMLMTDWDHAKSRDVDHVMGAFYLVRRRLFEGFGGFDDRFFLYLEDLDFSAQVAAAGWRSHYFAKARVAHASGGISAQIPTRRLFLSLQSRLLYSFKHFSAPAAWSVLLGTCLLEPWPRLLLALLHRSPKEAGFALGAFAQLYVSLPGIFITARRAGGVKPVAEALKAPKPGSQQRTAP